MQQKPTKFESLLENKIYKLYAQGGHKFYVSFLEL